MLERNEEERKGIGEQDRVKDDEGKKRKSGRREGKGGRESRREIRVREDVG